MDWIEYSYTIDWEKDLRAKPRVEVEFSNNGKIFTCPALIDSGADVTLITAEVAAKLGIDLSRCKRHTVTGVVGNSAAAYEAKLSLKVEKFKEPIDIDVVFVEGLNDEIALLGQYSFFEQYRVRFEKDRSAFFLMRAPKNDTKEPTPRRLEAFAGKSKKK